MTGEADNPMTGCDFDWMVSNHAVWGWKAPVKASVSGVSFLQLFPLFASIFPLSPQKRLILRLRNVSVLHDSGSQAVLRLEWGIVQLFGRDSRALYNCFGGAVGHCTIIWEGQ